MKKNVINVIKLLVKYLLPAVLGWLEGDSHAVADSVSALVNLLF